MAYQKAKLLLPFYQIDNINYHQVKIQVTIQLGGA